MNWSWLQLKIIADELLTRIPYDGMFPGSVYEPVTKYVPVVCTDAAAYLITNNGSEVLVLRRNTGVYADKLYLVGVRFLFGEPVDASLRRNFSTDLGI